MATYYYVCCSYCSHLLAVYTDGERAVRLRRVHLRHDVQLRRRVGVPRRRPGGAGAGQDSHHRHRRHHLPRRLHAHLPGVGRPGAGPPHRSQHGEARVRRGGLRRGLLRRPHGGGGQVGGVQERARLQGVRGLSRPRDGRPPHGRFGFRHPYDQYAKVGAAMRQCACCVEALISCAGASSRQRAPPPRLLGDACTRVGAWCARVLKEASACVATMTTSRGLGFAVAEMDAAVRELQSDLRALPPILAEEASETSLAEVISTSPLLCC
uniref:Uncharacterized protein n=1 Tax=Oryza sativa subsp. japonica TaxID=39947 RepID=Q6EU45_ORYSJ|nr:unknown protein [Oryza sativa Japonica Group]